MIPIRDSIPCKIRPYVTWAIMVICTVVFLSMLVMPNYMVQRFLYLYGMVPIRYTNPTWAQHFGLPPDYYLSFVTNIFIHGDWMHLLFNLMFLWIFADNIEDLMGHKRFIVFYLLCGIIATYAQWHFSRNLVIPVVGASGAIAGVLGAYFFRFPYARVVVVIPILFYPLIFEVPAIGFLGFWMILQLQEVTSIALFSAATSNVAWWAHVGGFVAGALLHSFFIDTPTDESGPLDQNQPTP
ncbi:MAG: rhomboid family intramembrane serine protease [Methylomonas sp.]|nr:rhomboid family intramembrane serine protease [Methylomonas sp.]PPD20263.1 MAG: rhomboid family intramembrane serine protease [Methylomonas sp.]PPD25181.1 MAG: rhomboid family intramembrane serine protease [Methylomonas sp.]PPD34812.1 MAG: rhomboid family intramembrane serine protease [Methylomonas sp.]PPD41192.1 MAG: rhomboid family intramembrane serine protease [Methylomonas sp.]